MGENTYSPKEKYHRWLIFGVVLSMVPVVVAIGLDCIRLDFDIEAAWEAHLFDFLLMVFAISGTLLEMAFDIERKMSAKARNKYIGKAGGLGLICLVLFEAFYPAKNTLPENGKIGIFGVSIFVCLLCICCGRRLLYVDPTRGNKQ